MAAAMGGVNAPLAPPAHLGSPRRAPPRSRPGRPSLQASSAGARSAPPAAAAPRRVSPLSTPRPRCAPALPALPFSAASSATSSPLSPSLPPAASPLRAPGRHPESASKLSRQFSANEGLVYLRDFFDAHAFEALRAECAALRPRLRRERSATAENRLGLYLPPHGATASAFRSPAVAERLSAIAGAPCFLSEYPLEYRSYPVGAHMAWHRDEVLFAVPQLELVLTLRNESDSCTEWIDGAGQLVRTATEANSLLAVRAGGALHRVTPVRRGERDIVKVVFAFGTERTAAYDENLAGTYL